MPLQCRRSCRARPLLHSKQTRECLSLRTPSVSLSSSVKPTTTQTRLATCRLFVGTKRELRRCGRQVMAIAQVIQRDFGGRRDLSGLGGVETGRDAAEFLLLGANSVQVRQATRSICLQCRLCLGAFLLRGASSGQVHPAPVCPTSATKLCL